MPGVDPGRSCETGIGMYVYYTWQNNSGVPSRLPTTPLHFVRRRFLLPLTFLLVGSTLDPFKHVRLVMQKHLAESAAWRLDQMTVAFGRFSACFDVVPNSVRMRDKDQGVLHGVSRSSGDYQGKARKSNLPLTSLYQRESHTCV